MSRFDYGKYFGQIEPLADALRENDERVWNSTVGKTRSPTSTYCDWDATCFAR